MRSSSFRYSEVVPYDVRVLHEDAARARDLVELRLQRVADAQRLRKVVAGVEHQAVSEPVHALVRDEAHAPDVLVVADPVRGEPEPELVLGHAHECPLDQAVVEARAAVGGALGERLGDVALMPGKTRCADRVHDAVAVGEDCRVGRRPALELGDRPLRPIGEGDVAEGLLETRVLAVVAILELGVVGLEPPGDVAAPFGRAGDVGGDGLDLLVAQLRLERGHAVPAAANLPFDPLGRERRLVEARADAGVRARVGKGVAVTAACVGENLGAGRALRRLPTAAAAGEDGDERERQDANHRSFVALGLT
jgi:hypothetical protein